MPRYVSLGVYNFDDCVKQKKTNICLKPVPCNQIVPRVMVKIAAIEFSPPPSAKKNRAGDLNPKKNPVEAVIVK